LVRCLIVEHSSVMMAASPPETGPRNVAASEKTMNEDDTIGAPPVPSPTIKPEITAAIPRTMLSVLTWSALPSAAITTLRAMTAAVTASPAARGRLMDPPLSVGAS